MHIINSRSNLTPQPLVSQGGHNTPKYGILVAKKCLGKDGDYRLDNNRGLSEHSTMLNMPYFSAHHNW